MTRPSPYSFPGGVTPLPATFQVEPHQSLVTGLPFPKMVLDLSTHLEEPSSRATFQVEPHHNRLGCPSKGGTRPEYPP